MKIKELEENEPLEVIEVSKRPKVTLIPDAVEFINIQTKILTDGEIGKESEENCQDIEKYYINGHKYTNVDTLKTKNIYFKNHSYVISYIVSTEFAHAGGIIGRFDFIRDVSIYLKNKKDKEALKAAKSLIKEIEKLNGSINYSNISSMLSSSGNIEKSFETEEISGNVYKLRKR